MSELQGERKVDTVAMREAVGQLGEELKACQRLRKEDADRLESAIVAISTRVDANARTARDQFVEVEQQTQVTATELQKEVDSRVTITTKLESRIAEERRFVEQSLAAEMKAREEANRLAEDGHKQWLAEESRKLRAITDKLGSTQVALSEDMQKERAAGADRARDLARGVAALQNSLSSEEQARQQSAWQLQQCVDAIREEVANEAKERRNCQASASEDVQLLQRGLQQRDDRTDALAQQLVAESADLRERIAREARQREAAVSQAEQRALAFQASRDNVPALQALALQSSTTPGGAEWKEFQQQTQEDLSRLRRSTDSLTAEQTSFGKAVGSLTDRIDTVRTGLTGVQSQLAEVSVKQKMLSEVEYHIQATREELLKEVADRRTEDERLARAQSDIDKKLDKTEQQRIRSEEALQQEVISTKVAMKKDVRDQELAVQRLQVVMREEVQKREEVIEREGRLRQEGQEKSTDAFQNALREERRSRESECLRLEGRSLASVGSKGGYPGGGDELAMQMDPRAIRHQITEMQQRFADMETRQKQAEEKTVSMLDAIMSGLTSPGD